MLDRTIIREIKTLAGNGSRESKFDFLKKIEAAKQDLSSIHVRDTFNTCLRTHGRASVAVCIAVTLNSRKDRLDFWGWRWANEVLSLLPSSITPSNLERANIDDGIHPTAICDYAVSFIKLTCENDSETGIY